MIVAAYAGTGKTTFAARLPGAMDLNSMPFCWLLPPGGGTAGEQEGEKGALYHLRDPRFPDNYVAAILRAQREHDLVLIPTNMQVVRRLEECGRKVVVCYPGDDCREEYRARFVARGNTADFLTLFADGWEYFLRPVREYPGGVHIVLRPGEYLTDYAARFEAERQAQITQPVSEEAIQALEERTAASRTGWGLCLPGAFYPISDLDEGEERRFLYRVGRMAYDRDVMAKIFPAEVLEERMGLPAVDRDGVMSLLERGGVGDERLFDGGHPRGV